jgi:6-pyruvoyltetrahydropterin/6-carboxytetrahydropterin synthase
MDNNLISLAAKVLRMRFRIYKEVSFDASHRLLHYDGKCARLHGHRWKVEVWMSGEISHEDKILFDYNTIRELVEQFDHQVILNREDPMVVALQPFQQVLTTPGDPTSELLALLIREALTMESSEEGRDISVDKIRVWESPTCYAELVHEGE